MDTVTFYTNPLSRGRIAHWMLEEVGAKFEAKLLDFEKKEHKDPKFLKINPMGKLPTIVHRNTVVTEGAAICAYLADAFPAAKLAPATDDPARGTYMRWLFFGAGCVEPALLDKMLARPPASRPESLGYGTYQETMDTLEKALIPGPFILGDRFSAADVYISAQISWGTRMKAIEPRPVFQKYVARCEDRPAFQRFNQKSMEWAAQMKASK